MNKKVVIRLQTSGEQNARLEALQQAFAEVCNALAPQVRDARTWNRVALHHLAYRDLRQRFPALGSQMACNAIYAVSRACRVVFQTRNSPFHASRWGNRPLPMLHFSADAPVFFDRHTLSIKDSVASIYTLSGRMKFHLKLNPEQEHAFHHQKLREIALYRGSAGFQLDLLFGEQIEEPACPWGAVSSLEPPIPHYLEVQEQA